jgi:hypothetical protein
MQIHDALAIHGSFIILDSLPTMPDKRTFDPFVPPVLDVM